MYVTYVSSCVYNMHIVLCNEVESGVHVCYTCVYMACVLHICMHTYIQQYAFYVCGQRARDRDIYILYLCV